MTDKHPDNLLTPRATPCASCPYRRGVPSGIWDDTEYTKLPRYDAEVPEQPTAVFLCHLDDGCVCAGWLGHADAAGLLAVRLGVIRGRLDPACLTYSTDVPLFLTGEAAATHGRHDIPRPTPRAAAAIQKLHRIRGLSNRDL
ncbi:hypothetical protein HQQ86_20460 [Rathayibacter sp. VKM Ac-2857]|nr:hypothetical protein [Rathayibacter sp. VKM Ac-2857]